MRTTGMSVTRPEIGHICEEVAREVERAIGKFPPFHTGHEGKAIIEEELEELWELIRANDSYGEAARTEAIQLAAMAVRYVYDLTGVR